MDFIFSDLGSSSLITNFVLFWLVQKIIVLSLANTVPLFYVNLNDHVIDGGQVKVPKNFFKCPSLYIIPRVPTFIAFIFAFVRICRVMSTVEHFPFASDSNYII